MNKLSLKPLVIALFTIFFLSACTTIDPYTDRPKTSSTAKGAGIGAVSGALLGALVGGSHHRAEGALIGAGVGALAGAGIGHSMDEQEAELRHRLRDSGVSVTRHRDSVILNLPDNITFDTGRASIRSPFYNVLDSVAIVINKFDGTFVEIAGHTDNVGNPQSNQVLSEQRAESVAAHLRSQRVSPERLIARGYGESRPIADNRTPSGRAQNRRVEITLSPRG